MAAADELEALADAAEAEQLRVRAAGDNDDAAFELARELRRHLRAVEDNTAEYAASGGADNLVKVISSGSLSCALPDGC